jgi:hypothetical protein
MPSRGMVALLGIVGLVVASVVITMWVRSRESFEASTTQLADPNLGRSDCIGTSVPDYGVMWACDSNKEDILRIIRSTRTREDCARRCISEMPESEAQGLCLLMCGSPFDCDQALALARIDDGGMCTKTIERPYA